MGEGGNTRRSVDTRMNRQISVYRERRDLFRGAAALIASLCEAAVRERGFFAVALSGGKTPEGLYALLAAGGGPEPGFTDADPRARIPWDKVLFFWGDERFVPHDHPESNYGMARRTLLSKIAIPKKNVFPIPTDAGTPERAAEMYERTIMGETRLRREAGMPGAIPSFDLILLGIGRDGHTASLYPGSDVLRETRRLVRAAEAPAADPSGPAQVGTVIEPRVTMTLPLINNALNALFLVTGEDKKETLLRVLSGPPEDGRPELGPLPAQMVRPRDTLYVFTDIAIWQI